MTNSNSSINGHWLGRFSRLNDSFIGKKTLQTTDQIVSVTSGHGTIRVEVTDRATGGNERLLRVRDVLLVNNRRATWEFELEIQRGNTCSLSIAYYL